MFAPVAEVDALAVVRGAVDSGVRLIDTAPYYGSGLAETRVGDSLEGRSRGEFALSTKVGRLLDRDVPPDVDWTGEPFFKGAPPLGAVFDFSYDGVLRSLEQSLERLRPRQRRCRARARSRRLSGPGDCRGVRCARSTAGRGHDQRGRSGHEQCRTARAIRPGG